MVTFRRAEVSDAAAIHRLISDNLEVGHLLPRTRDDVVAHASRFIVAEADQRVIGCTELAPLSAKVAEVRSLVVDQDARGNRIGPRLLTAESAPWHSAFRPCARSPISRRIS
jgi:amino-acid N-acetyltransferase